MCHSVQPCTVCLKYIVVFNRGSMTPWGFLEVLQNIDLILHKISDTGYAKGILQPAVCKVYNFSQNVYSKTCPSCSGCFLSVCLKYCMLAAVFTFNEISFFYQMI